MARLFSFLVMVLMPIITLGQNIPGGIACAVDGKIQYLDFSTHQKITLTDPEKDEKVNGLFDVSRDGSAIVWRQVGGDELIIKTSNSSSTAVKKIPFPKFLNSDTFLDGAKWEKKNYVPTIADIQLSCTGTKIVFFEKGRPNVSMKKVPAGHPLFKPRNSGHKEYDDAPSYASVRDTFDAVITKDISDLFCANSGFGIRGLFGNTIARPPVPNYHFLSPLLFEDDSMTENVFYGEELKNLWNKLEQIYWHQGNFGIMSAQDTLSKIGTKRNAIFACWSKVGKTCHESLFAVILKKDNGWDLELMDETKQHPIGQGYVIPKGMKAGLYTIPVSFKGDCLGMAWKPNGDLTILTSKEGLLTFSRVEIDKGRAKSGLARNPRPHATGITDNQPVMVNNTFAIKPKIVAGEKIIGTKPIWATDNILLYRGIAEDKGLYVWEKGKTQKLFNSLPEKYCYCETAPVGKPLPTGEVASVTSVTK
jgi:hypothetical protein